MTTNERPDNAEELEQDRIEHLTDRLKDDFPDVPASTVEQTVDREYHHLDEQPIRDFVPVLVEHNAKAALRGA